MRASTDRRARSDRLAHFGERTSPAKLVLPSLVIQVEPGAKLGVTAVTRVEIHGELDALTAGRSTVFLLSLLDEHPPTIVLDLSNLTFCDAGGLGVFVRLANSAEAAGGCVTLTGVRPMLARQLRVTGLDRRFPDEVRPGAHSATR